MSDISSSALRLCLHNVYQPIEIIVYVPHDLAPEGGAPEAQESRRVLGFGSPAKVTSIISSGRHRLTRAWVQHPLIAVFDCFRGSDEALLMSNLSG